MIFMFLKDKLVFNQINTLATQPINVSDQNKIDLLPPLDVVRLVTLDPITADELHEVSHDELHLMDLNLLKVHNKLEVMGNDHYVAKVTCTRSKLQLIHPLVKDNP
jgi:hypothetical protein